LWLVEVAEEAKVAEVIFEELVMEPDDDDDMLDEVWRPESAVEKSEQER
jgi:hypothetical protein